ncbi:MAG TPA: DUF561 domain-containing protein [Bacteroidota bacterium]|nr:DUF561 domain-containing protein [Bacteroidota bacterium]
MNKNILELFKIKYPIIQAGMVWVSGAKLAAAVSNCGCLGLIGSGSMKPDLLREHINKVRLLTNNSFGVNIPLSRGDVDDLIQVVLEENVKIIFTSSGSPDKFTPILKNNGCVVVQVVSNVKQAKKSELAGCDAIVAEGYEAGGHNGKDELTTFSLVPQVVDSVNIPVIAAGGIADGRGMLAAFSLGASGVQIGTLFAASTESSAHINYKNAIVSSKDNSTQIFLRRYSPIRAIKNSIVNQILEAESKCLSDDEIKKLIDQKREMRGIFEGNIDEGFLEVGQSAGLVKEIKPVKKIIQDLIEVYNKYLGNLQCLEQLF